MMSEKHTPLQENNESMRSMHSFRLPDRSTGGGADRQYADRIFLQARNAERMTIFLHVPRIDDILRLLAETMPNLQISTSLWFLRVFADYL